jgi:hypothetical protein
MKFPISTLCLLVWFACKTNQATITSPSLVNLNLEITPDFSNQLNDTLGINYVSHRISADTLFLKTQVLVGKSDEFHCIISPARTKSIPPQQAIALIRKSYRPLNGNVRKEIEFQIRLLDLQQSRHALVLKLANNNQSISYKP